MFSISKVLRGLVFSKYRFKMLPLRKNRLTSFNMSVHTSANLTMKMFMELENKYAYNLMRSKGYTISLDRDTKETELSEGQFEQIMKEDWSKLQPTQIFEIFPIIGEYCTTHGLCISNKIFDDFIDSLTDTIQCASYNELKSIFYYLVRWPETESLRTRNYIEVWAALDEACLNRMKEWDFDKMLEFLALFFMLNVTKVSDFSIKCINKLATKAKQLTPSQLVQTMFYVGVLRKQPFDVHNLELHMIDSFEKLSIDDVAIISMGFFKSKTPIRSMEIMQRIIDKIIENQKDIHEVSLAAILKLIRYSVKINTDDKIYRLLDALQHEVNRLSVMSIVHIALLGTSTLTLHKDCLTVIAERMINSLADARIKDLERLVLTFGTFSFVPQLKAKDCLFEKITDELRKPEREAEIKKHGKSFACCISYLGLLGKYPVDLMAKVLNSTFLENTYGKHCASYGREILTVHNTSLLFCPKARMDRLSDKAVIILAKKYTDFVPDEDYKKQYNVTERMFLNVFKHLRDQRGGNEFVTGDHVLPHHQRGDIILCNSRDGRPLPVTEKLGTKFGLMKQPPDGNHWIAVVIAGRNVIIQETDYPTGHFQTKIRELKALGYHGVLVPWSIYNSLKTSEDTCAYLNDLIYSAIK